ncbi:MAG: phosphotransferase [Candidatus Micrarchaeota archaeon]|nr:phosphotransferase [Candidatus Micrarchaeota archaeon]
MDKAGLSELLTKKLNREVEVTDIVKVGSGFHSNGYKIATKGGENYFIKQVTSEDMGFEFPERKLMSLLVSHSMLSKHENYPNSIGVAIKNDKFEFLPEIDENTQVYHLQEYGGEGKSYMDLLNEKVGKSTIDNTDKQEIDKVVNFLVSLHKNKPASKDPKLLTAIYNDYLRSVIGHPEYLLLLLQRVPDSSPVLRPTEQGGFIALMLEGMHYFKGRPERLCAIHGDFWGANVFFKQDNSIFVIDYSRMPWGDPGFDVGVWMSQYLIKYHITNSNYFRQLGDYFLEQYMSRTEDKGVVNTMVYPLGVVSVIYSHEDSVPGIPDVARKAFYANVTRMLKNKQFSWE